MYEYKRATRQLIEASLYQDGCGDIIIYRTPHGAMPWSTQMARQSSRTFPSWQEAVAAVLDGYRPEETPEEEPDEL